MALMQTTSDTEVLARLADDVRVAAWLLPADDELRGHLELLGSLPARMDAWDEVLRPWLHAMRGGGAPEFDAAPRVAAAGALAVAAARAARELAEDEPLATPLRCLARWCARVVGAPVA
jgi:hypothetical protein